MATEVDCTPRGEAHRGGYDFSGVDPRRIYSIREAAALVGMTYREALGAAEKGCLRVQRSGWNPRRLFVRGSELKRLAREEFTNA